MPNFPVTFTVTHQDGSAVNTVQQIRMWLVGCPSLPPPPQSVPTSPPPAYNFQTDATGKATKMITAGQWNIFVNDYQYYVYKGVSSVTSVTLPNGT